MGVFRFLSFVVGPLDTNCYLVYDEEAREGVVIDPGGDAEELAELLRWVDRLGLRVVAIVVTHGHFDHFLGAPYLSRELGAPIYMNPRDAEVARVSAKWSPAFGYEEVVLEEFEPLSEGSSIRFGDLELKPIETPGHSPGSTCLYVEGEALFSGDTLFAGTVGRTDLPGGSHRDLLRSIAKIFSSLPLGTRVYPGHGPSTTLRRELRANPFVEDALRLASHG